MNLKLQPRGPRFEPNWFCLSIAFVILTCGSGLAQSGRTRTGPPPKSDPATTTTSTTAGSDNAADPKIEKERRISLVTAKHVSANNTGFETGIAFRSFLARLQESGFLIVSSREDLRRKEAIELARSGENVYVAWFQLELDLMGSADAKTDAEKAAVTPINPACLFVTYAIYAPGTGKPIAQGHVYQPGYQDRCAGTVYHPSPYPDRQMPTRGTTPELELKRAGGEAADRIMTALNIAVPAKHP